MTALTIGKLANATDVGIDTVRFYERAGLLKKPDRTAGGYRLYDASDADRLRFIRRAKALGFSLDEIRELLKLNDGGGKRAAVRSIAGRRLSEIEQKLAELRRMRQTLRHLVHHCDGHGSLEGCPIIAAVLGDAPKRPNASARHKTA